MKCPKCGYVSFNYLDSCKKCKTDLVDYKETMGIWGAEPGSVNLLYLEKEEQAQKEEVPLETERASEVSLEEPDVTLEELKTDLQEEAGEEVELVAHEIPIEEETEPLMEQDELSLDLGELEEEEAQTLGELSESENGVEIAEEEGAAGGMEPGDVPVEKETEGETIDLSGLDEDMSLEGLQEEGLQTLDEPLGGGDEGIEIAEEETLPDSTGLEEAGQKEEVEEAIDLSGLDEDVSLEELQEEMAVESEEEPPASGPASPSEKGEGRAAPVDMEEFSLDFDDLKVGETEDVKEEGLEGSAEDADHPNEFHVPKEGMKKGPSVDLSDIEEVALEEDAPQEEETSGGRAEPADLDSAELVQDKTPSGLEPAEGIKPPDKDVDFELDDDWLSDDDKKEGGQ